ncbi:MAG: PAS domain S-box protein, partial [Spirulina sp. DLM2.Bin59]
MNALAQTLIVPPHICYVVLDDQWQILDHSPPVAFGTWLDPDLPLRASDIRDHFPELFGCEEIFSDILAGNLPLFTLNGMTRTTANGENFYLDLHLQAAPPTGEALQPTTLILFIEDVTEKMRLEQVLVQSTNEANLLLNALTASKQYIDRIVTAIADALIVTTPHQIIKTVNEATEKLFGYRQEELIGQSLALLIVEAEPLFTELYDSIQNYGELSRNLEVVCQHRSGVKLTVAFSCSLIHTEAQEDGEHHLIPDIVYIGRDVTERQRTQQRLAAQYAIARILSEATTLEAATHEILKAIGENLDWDVGELWLPSTTAERKPALPQPDDMIWQRSGEP